MVSSSSEKYHLLRHEAWNKSRPFWYLLAFGIKLGKACTKNALVHYCNIAEVTET